MSDLVSPEYDLKRFCSHMRGKDSMADAASAEISCARVFTVKLRRPLISAKDRKEDNTVKPAETGFVACEWFGA